MTYLQGAKEYNTAAIAPDQHADIVEILARTEARRSTAVLNNGVTKNPIRVEK